MGTVLELVGSSPSADRARSVVTRVSRGNDPVMVVGEGGLDAVAVARAIHDAGRLAAGPFVLVDCAAGAAGELEHAMFGAPASTDRGEPECLGDTSLIGSASGGTLVIANLSELPSQLQGRLTRVLRDRRVEMASGGSVVVDARVIATVRGNVEEEIHDGKLRRELCVRFPVTLDLPPLRHRPADIPMLIGCVAAEVAAASGADVPVFSPEAVSLLAALPWRRNLDELREVLETLVRAAAGGAVHLADVLGHVPVERMTTSRDDAASLRDARNAFEREYIAAALNRHGWRMDEAARALGIQRTNLYRKVRQLGIARARSHR